MQRWKDGLCTHEPELPADLRVLEQRIGESKTRKLRHDGFELNNIRYNSHVLLPIIRRFGEGVEIRVVFNPEDLGEVQVWGPDDFDPVSVQALDLQFARGLTARQVALIAQLAREQGGKTVDVKALQRAREDITNEIEKLASSRKLKARRRSAANQQQPSQPVIPSTCFSGHDSGQSGAATPTDKGSGGNAATDSVFETQNPFPVCDPVEEELRS
jgi:putative transposase